MTRHDDATTAARDLTSEQAAAHAEAYAILAANCRAILLAGIGDDTARTSLGLYEAAARACRLRSTALV
jgi:hypothetical protein